MGYCDDQVAVGDIIFDISTETELEKQKTPYIPVAEENNQPKFFDIINNLLNLANQGNQNLQKISNYQIIKSLGEGGCGEVFLAEHIPTRKRVALKLMLPKVATKEREHINFVRTKELNRL